MLSFWQLWLRSQVKGHLQMWVGALGCYALRCLVIAYNEASNCINFINKTVLKCGTCIIWIWWDILISVGDWCGSLNLLSVKTDVLGILMLQLFHVCTKYLSWKITSLWRTLNWFTVGIYCIWFDWQELVFTASPDCTIRVWGVETAQCAQVIRAHEAPVTGISLHATGDYLLSSSTDMVSGDSVPRSYEAPVTGIRFLAY